MSGFKLRPHHGLCIQLFRGEGYSKGFVQNLSKLITCLGYDTSIIITLDVDDAICSHCPNNKMDSCADQDKARRYDRVVMDLCNLKEGQVIKWGEFKDLVYRNIISNGEMKRICRDCEWSHICFD